MRKEKQAESTEGEVKHGETLPALRKATYAFPMALGDPPDLWPTNLDLADTRNRGLLANAQNPPELKLPDRGEIRINLVAYVCYLYEVADRVSGEIKTAPRTVLITDDGKMFATASDYAPLKMRTFQTLFPPEQWKRGIPVRIREHHSPESGNDSIVIEYDTSRTD